MSRVALLLASRMVDLESVASEVKWTRDVTTRGLVTREMTSHGGITARSEMKRLPFDPIIKTTMKRQPSYVVLPKKDHLQVKFSKSRREITLDKIADNI